MSYVAVLKETPKPVMFHHEGLPSILMGAKRIETLTDPHTGHRIEYWTYEDDDGDCRKLWHYLWDTDSDTIIEPDFTPYRSMSPSDLRIYLMLGCPKRIDICPLRSEDLPKIAETASKGVGNI